MLRTGACLPKVAAFGDSERSHRRTLTHYPLTMLSCPRRIAKMLVKLTVSTVPAPLRCPLLVDRIGLPRYWIVVWMSFLPSDMAESTLIRILGYLDRFYRYVDGHFGPAGLDNALGDQNVDQLGEMLEGHFQVTRNQGACHPESGAGWQTSLRFVREILTWISKAKESKYRMHELKAKLSRFEMLYSQLRVNRRRKVQPIRSHTESIVDLLYDILDPESKRNPFPRSATRWRVYVIFIALLVLGLRRGELLILPLDAVRSEWDKKQGRTTYYLRVIGNEYEDDPRHSKPSIKTAPSMRRIPISPLIAKVFFEYQTSHRGRPGHSFLMNSYRNRPLSTEGVSKLFARITAALPESAIRDLRDRTGAGSITPHGLRHTSVVVRLTQFRLQNSPEEAESKLRTFFGWSRSSDMPQRYARAYYENTLAAEWCAKFDERFSFLRGIPKAL